MKAFEITWKDGAYRVSIPNYLTEGERRKIIEAQPVFDLLERAHEWLRRGEVRIDEEMSGRSPLVMEIEDLLREHGRLP